MAELHVVHRISNTSNKSQGTKNKNNDKRCLIIFYFRMILGFDNWSTIHSTVLCRQASEEEAGLWLQDDYMFLTTN